MHLSPGTHVPIGTSTLGALVYCTHRQGKITAVLAAQRVGSSLNYYCCGCSITSRDPSPGHTKQYQETGTGGPGREGREAPRAWVRPSRPAPPSVPRRPARPAPGVRRELGGTRGKGSPGGPPGPGRAGTEQPADPGRRPLRPPRLPAAPGLPYPALPACSGSRRVRSRERRRAAALIAAEGECRPGRPRAGDRARPFPRMTSQESGLPGGVEARGA